MRALRTHILTAVLALCVYAAAGQQLPGFSQSFLIPYQFNPALSGEANQFEALAVHRSQWIGINDAPRTYYLGLHAPDASRKMGFGGSVFTDVAGPTRRFGVKGSYAYHLKTSETTKLSLGVSFGLLQFSIDGSQVDLRDPGDQTLMPQMESEIKPDASFGVLWYSDKFRVGASAVQLINNRLDLYPGDESGRLAVHYYLHGAYLFDVGGDFGVEPNLLVKYVQPFDPQFEIGARGIYRDKLWLGASFRNRDAAAIYAGYEIMDYLTVGYSYDLTTSELKHYNSGTHEIVLRVRFGELKATQTESETQ